MSAGGATLHLYTNNLTPTKGSVLGDFVELSPADVPGYNPATFDVSAFQPWRLPTGEWQALDNADATDFQSSSAPIVHPILVYGFFITDTATGLILLGSGRFASPFDFATQGDGFAVVPTFTLVQTPPGAVVTFEGMDYNNLVGPSMYIVPDPIMGSVLTAIELALGTAITGLVDIHLYTNNLTPTKTNVLADFTELTNVEVPGYVKKTANWFAGVPARQQDGSWEAPNTIAPASFVATGPPPLAQIVYGFFVTDSTDAILLGSGRFNTPFTFTKTGDGFSMSDNPSLLQGDGQTLTLSLADLEPE